MPAMVPATPAAVPARSASRMATRLVTTPLVCEQLAAGVVRVDHVALGDLGLADCVVAEVRAIGLEGRCGGLSAAEEVFVADLRVAQRDHLLDDAVELGGRLAARGGVGGVASLAHAQLLGAGEQVGKLVERGLFGVDTDPNGGGVAAILGDPTKTAVGSHDPGGGDGIFGGTGESFARGHLLLRVGQIRRGRPAGLGAPAFDACCW